MTHPKAPGMVNVRYTLHVSVPDASYFTPGIAIATLPKVRTVIDGSMAVQEDGGQQAAINRILTDHAAKLSEEDGLKILPTHIEVESARFRVIEDEGVAPVSPPNFRTSAGLFPPKFSGGSI